MYSGAMTTTQDTRPTVETMWTGSTGCTTYAAGGHRGTVTAFHYTAAGRTTAGAFVRLDETDPGAMWFVTLGAETRDHHREVTGASPITRDEFDSLTGLAELRREMGWAA